MSLVGRLDDWRTTMREWAAKDGEPEPTEEQVLSQFLYSAIANFLEAELAEIEATDCSGSSWDDTEHRADAWVSLYAAQDVAAWREPPKVPTDRTRRVPVDEPPRELTEDEFLRLAGRR